MRDERCLDMDQIAIRRLGQHGAVHGPPADHAILGVARNRAPGDPDNPRLIGFIAVARHDQFHLDPLCGEGTPKGFD